MQQQPSEQFSNNLLAELSAVAKESRPERHLAAALDCERGRMLIKQFMPALSRLSGSLLNSDCDIRPLRLEVSSDSLPPAARVLHFGVFAATLSVGLPARLAESFTDAAELIRRLHELEPMARNLALSDNSTGAQIAAETVYLIVRLRTFGADEALWLGFDRALISRLSAYRRSLPPGDASRARLDLLRRRAGFSIRIPLYSLASAAALTPGGIYSLASSEKAFWSIDIAEQSWSKRFHLGIEDCADFTASLRILRTTLHKAKDVMKTNLQAGFEDSVSSEGAGPKLLGAELTLELGSLWLGIEQLVDLTPGNLIELSLPKDGTLSLSAEGVEVAKGVLVRHEGKLALQIISVLDEDGTQQTEKSGDHSNRGESPEPEAAGASAVQCASLSLVEEI